MDTTADKVDYCRHEIETSIADIVDLLNEEIDRWRQRAIDAEDRESELEDEIEKLKAGK